MPALVVGEVDQCVVSRQQMQNHNAREEVERKIQLRVAENSVQSKRKRKSRARLVRFDTAVRWLTTTP
jgi:hypothetical protein